MQQKLIIYLYEKEKYFFLIKFHIVYINTIILISYIQNVINILFIFMYQKNN